MSTMTILTISFLLAVVISQIFSKTDKTNKKKKDSRTFRELFTHDILEDIEL